MTFALPTKPPTAIRERDTYITEHFSRSQRCCSLKADRKHEHQLEDSSQTNDDMDARPVTDSNCLAPNES